MIPAEYYNLVYCILLVIFAIPVCLRYQGQSSFEIEKSYSSQHLALLFTFFIILFIGLRPNSGVFADGPSYWGAMLDHRWEYYSLESVNYQFATKFVMSTMSFLGFSGRTCFIVLASIIYGFAYVAMRKLFPNDTLLAMIMFCGTFGIFGGAVNGIKNGCGCSLFLCALAYKDDKLWKWLVFLILSFGFHHSLELSIGAFVLCLFYKNTKVYYLLWAFSLGMAIAHNTFFQVALSGLTDEHGASYLLADSSNIDVQGFRPDFVLYSIVPMVLGYWVIFKKKVDDELYTFCLNVYIVTNSIWLLCMYSSFTNRIAALSWVMFPIVLLYPFLKFNLGGGEGKRMNLFVVGQLAFSLLMSVIYINRYAF